MGKKTIVQQMRYVLNSHEAFGQSKRAAKFSNPDEKQLRIYAYSSKKNLTDFSKHLSSWMKSNHPEVKWVTDITSQHIAEFLEYGLSEKKWTHATYNANVALASKMGLLIRNEYGRGHDWSEGIQRISEPEKLRSVAMTREHMNKLLDSVWFSKSEGAWGMRLAEAFGLRASESVKLTLNDIDKTADTVHVRGKGGRDRYIPVLTSHQREVLADFERYAAEKGVSEAQRVLDCKPPAVEAYIRRTLEKANISVYKEHNTGVHAIRKLWAQERYIAVCEASGVSPMNDTGWIYHAKEWDEVAAELGHGRDRTELFKAYVNT